MRRNMEIGLLPGSLQLMKVWFVAGEKVQELEANTVVVDMDESMEEEPDDAEDWNSDWSEEMYCKSKMNWKMKVNCYSVVVKNLR